MSNCIFCNIVGIDQLREMLLTVKQKYPKLKLLFIYVARKIHMTNLKYYSKINIKQKT